MAEGGPGIGDGCVRFGWEIEWVKRSQVVEFGQGKDARVPNLRRSGKLSLSTRLDLCVHLAMGWPVT